ncbi:MAG: MarR family transcriptional regulator [Bacteroidales bacterium]
MVTEEMAREVMYALLRVQTSFRQAIQRSMKQHNIDLTFEMLQIMVYLWRKDGINQQELADSTFKDKASLSALLNNLETKKLVKRIAATHDRRNKNILLTEHGKECGKLVKPLLSEIYQTVGLKMDSAETALCVNYLQNLNHVFKEI